jgi:beta-fructofuranosidase
MAKLRLWPILNGNTSTLQTLNLTIIVDNSALEVYANDVAVITTRIYPWLTASNSAGFVVSPPSNGVGNGSVGFDQLELWDGLVNAWPERPLDSSKPLVNDGPLPEIWGGLWVGD